MLVKTNESEAFTLIEPFGYFLEFLEARFLDLNEV